VHISSNQYNDKNFSGWLYTIASNLVKDYFKRYGKVAPPQINETEPEEATAKAFLETEPDTRPQPDEQAIGKEQLVFIETVLNEILIENQPTDEKKKRGELKKMAFYLFVIDKLDIPEIQEELMPVAHYLGIRLPHSFFKNWKRDIVKPFCNHVVEKYPFWIQELICEERLKKSLTETEYAIVSLLWNQGRNLRKVVEETQLSVEQARSLFKQAKEKIKRELVKALGGRIQRK
jgi:DNA-directed RNA polymerase specialized sigma24 family protein